MGGLMGQSEGKKLLSPERIESAVAAWGSPIWGDKPPKGDNATIQRLTVTLAAYAEVVQAVAEKDPTWDSDDGDSYCVYCYGEDDGSGSFQHEEDCPHILARELRGLE